MSKKLILLSIVLGVILIGVAGYYFLMQTNPEIATSISTGFKNFFPFGNGDGNGGTATSTGNGGLTPPTPPSSSTTNVEAKLRKLSEEPVAGAGTMDVKIGTVKLPKTGTIVRYIEKATGHIFETELFSVNKKRISNTTIPTVADGIWGNKNTALVARYLKSDNETVDTYSLILKTPAKQATTTENMISGIAFPGNISDVSVFDTNIFYLIESLDSSAGYIANWTGTNKKQIWNSPVRDVLSQFVNVNTVALTTKPAQNFPGFMYFVNTSSGAVRKILGDIPGLSTNTNSDATKVLYLSQTNGVGLSTFDISSKNSVSVTPVTFPEKCVWSKKDKNLLYCAVPKDFLDGSSLTLWYKGLISTTDDIWKIDTKNNVSSIILDLSSESGEQIDVIKPILSDSEQYLVFMNKQDNTLWSLDMTK